MNAVSFVLKNSIGDQHRKQVKIYKTDIGATSSTNGLSFFQNDGNGGFGVAGSLNAGQAPWCAAVGDLNRDGFKILSSAASTLRTET